MNNVIENIKKELESFNNKKKELVEILRKEFPQMFKPLFEKSKLINSIGWNQYTPYFNDGDSCEFSVNSDLYINEEYEDACEFLDWRIKYYLKGDKEYTNLLIENPNINLDEYKVYEQFSEILSEIPNDFMLDLFGDHVQVTINRDGTIETEEYDHD